MFILLPLAALALYALAQAGFDIPGWLTQLGPAIIYVVGKVIFPILERAKGEELGDWDKRVILLGTSIALAGVLVLSGATPVPEGPTGDEPLIYGDYIRDLGIWFWSGATGIFVMLKAAGAVTGFTRPKAPRTPTY